MKTFIVIAASVFAVNAYAAKDSACASEYAAALAMYKEEVAQAREVVRAKYAASQAEYDESISYIQSDKNKSMIDSETGFWYHAGEVEKGDWVSPELNTLYYIYMAEVELARQIAMIYSDEAAAQYTTQTDAAHAEFKAAEESAFINYHDTVLACYEKYN